MRLLLCAATIFVGYSVVPFSIAQAVAGADLDLARLLAPSNGRVMSLQAAALAADGATAEDRRHADDLAKAALRRDPTDVVAASTLGLNADLRGEKDRARGYFTYAQKLSRRNLRTQLWMIETAVDRGDVAGALRQYDIALRVHPVLGEMLFPILASASSDPSIGEEVVRTVGRRPPWGEEFVRFLAGNGPNPTSTAALLIAMRRSGAKIPAAADADILKALLNRGDADTAWAYYASIRPGVDRSRSRDTGLNARLVVPSQLDWNPVTDAGVSAALASGGFEFSAPPSVGGPALQQTQLLPPGDYRLVGHSTGIEQRPSSKPYMVLSCLGGQEIGRLDIPNSNVDGGNFLHVFRVPAECPIQVLTLAVRPSDTATGVSGQIDQLSLEPERS